MDVGVFGSAIPPAAQPVDRSEDTSVHESGGTVHVQDGRSPPLSSLSLMPTISGGAENLPLASSIEVVHETSKEPIGVVDAPTVPCIGRRNHSPTLSVSSFRRGSRHSS